MFDVGLVAVSDIGAGVIAFSNRKPKNVPVNKSQASPDESDPDK